VLDMVASPGYRQQAETLGRRMRERLDVLAAQVETVGDVRGLGPMLALEIVKDRDGKEPAADIVGKATAAAKEQGVLLISCGIYGNVIRLLPPITITDADLDHGLEVLEESLAAASAG
jgi:4-aminobutyrate aminotransferase-like enzyme